MRNVGCHHGGQITTRRFTLRPLSTGLPEAGVGRVGAVREQQAQRRSQEIVSDHWNGQIHIGVFDRSKRDGDADTEIEEKVTSNATQDVRSRCGEQCREPVVAAVTHSGIGRRALHEGVRNGSIVVLRR